MTDNALPNPSKIGIEFFDITGAKKYSIINNENTDNSINGKNIWYTYQLNEPIYLTSISIIIEGYGKWDEFKFQITHIDGSQFEERIRPNGNQVQLSLGRFATKISLRPPSRLFSQTKICSVTIEGLTTREFREYETEVRTLKQERANLDDRMIEFEETSARSSQLTEEIKEKSSQAETLEDRIKNLESIISNRETQLADTEDRKKKIEDNIASLQKSRSSLNEENSTLKKKHTELTREIRVFPSEIAGYVREGNRNIISYAILSIPFVLILGIVTYSLFTSAIEFTQAWKNDPDINVWTVFLTRIPYAVVAVILIEVCGFAVGRFISEIIRINRQRTDFAKISIIAKDVSQSASQGTELSEDAIFEKETKLKMNLLREHMKESVDADLSFRGSAMTAAIARVAENFANRLTGTKSE